MKQAEPVLRAWVMFRNGGWRLVVDDPTKDFGALGLPMLGEEVHRAFGPLPYGQDACVEVEIRRKERA